MSAVKTARLASIVNGGLEFSIVPKIVCADGFTMLVQASYGHYCKPRPPFDENERGAWSGPYFAVEVGCPSARPEPWAKWCVLADETYDEDSDWTEADVYGFVPVQMVRDLIAAHGGER